MRVTDIKMKKYLHSGAHTGACGDSCGCHEEQHIHTHASEDSECCTGHSHEPSDGLTCGCCGNADEKDARKEKIGLIIGILLYAVAESVHLLSGEGGYSIPVIVMFVVAYLILGGGVLLNAAKNLGKGQVFDENFLMSIATLGAFAIQKFPEAAGVMLFFRVGELFEEIAVEKSRGQIMKAADMRPETVNLIVGEKTEIVHAESAKVGDIILVRPGDRIPLDGIVVEGESRIDTSAITGEPVPVRAEKGTSILSGCMNVTGAIKLRVEKTLSESMVTKILDSVENASANKPRMAHFITRFARIYTPIVVAVALFTAIAVPLLTGQAFFPWIYTALTFLVMSCPCALVLSVPLAFYCGIGSASRKGILFKGGITIEALASVKAVVLDKTGTITKGEFIVQKLNPADGFTQDGLLLLAASCESASSHPIAESISAAADEKGLILEKAASVEEIAGKGVRAVINGQECLCGNRQFLEENGVLVQNDGHPLMGTEVLLAVSGRYAGSIAISDTMKEEAESVVWNIRKENLRTVMLTGDTQESADLIAEKSGIHEVYAKLLPQEKLEKIQEIRNQSGKVLFVGDGINDAPVLAGADVGAAMGSGADAAIEAADLVYMNSNMEAISQSYRISRYVMTIARQNVTIALAIKFAVMALGLSGIYSNMWLAVFADTGVACICILNSVRALYAKS